MGYLFLEFSSLVFFFMPYKMWYILSKTAIIDHNVLAAYFYIIIVVMVQKLTISCFYFFTIAF